MEYKQSQTYKGSELILAQTPEELYDSVITRFGSYLGTREDFVREFNRTKKEVKNANTQTNLNHSEVKK